MIELNVTKKEMKVLKEIDKAIKHIQKAENLMIERRPGLCPSTELLELYLMENKLNYTKNYIERRFVLDD